MCKHLLVLFIIIGIGASGCLKNKPEIKQFANECILENGKQCILTIENNGTAPAEFTFRAGTSFFTNEKEIADDIYKGQTGAENKHRLAWEYVMQNINYCIPYSNKRWQHHPLLMFNSLGNGQCDDLASVLAFIWKEQGFKSRVWALEGHVVPEVFVNGKWEMYDPSFGVYYLNDDNEVASVEELVEDTSLIRRNIRFTDNTNYVSKLIASSNFLALSYFSKEDNLVNNWYDYKMDTVDLIFHLPAGSKFSYTIEKFNPKKLNGKLVTNDYSFGTIEIEDNKKCKVKAPLILYDISGKGEVIINDKPFNIGSEELTTRIQQSENFISEIIFKENHSNVAINYLINKRQFKKSPNQVTLSGLNLKGVDIECIMKDVAITEIEINMDSVINHYYNIYSTNRFVIEKHFNQRDTIDAFVLSNNIIAEFIRLDATLSNKQKEAKLNHLAKQMDLIRNSLNIDEAYLVINKICYPETMIIFIACAENYSGDDFLNLMARPM